MSFRACSRASRHAREWARARLHLELERELEMVAGDGLVRGERAHAVLVLRAHVAKVGVEDAVA
eukprot:3594844-Pleurochrysis_carterae.AAC.5